MNKLHRAALLAFETSAIGLTALSVMACSPLSDSEESLVPDGESGMDSPGSGANVTEPGVVTLRRLNRLEYNNSVRDLLGTDLTPADNFPDDTDSGFDTSAQALTISPTHARLYLSAAQDLAEDVVNSAPEARPAVFVCDPATGGQACAQEIIQRLAHRAFRRPVTEDELTPFYGLVDQAMQAGGTLDDGLSAAIEAIILSPHFMMRVEIDPDPNSEEAHPLSPHELATRLSYFLWSSIPDDELLALADSGALSDPAVLEQTTRRLLSDPRSAGLVEGFGKTWLLLDSFDKHIVDETTFPGFGDTLKASMREETSLFFSDFLENERPVSDMLTADFTFVDANLAAHYGLPHSGNAGFERVSTAGSERFGLFTQGSILTATSGSARTAPVKRGLWVLDALLCAPPPPPPANIPALEEEAEGQVTRTLREQIEAHRAQPSCFGCHQLLDPPGLALEHYDAIGAYRTEDHGLSIDPSGELSDGTTFADARELSTILSEDDAFSDCVVEQLMSFALGRDFRIGQYDDRAWVEEIATQSRSNGASLSTVISQVVQSTPFVTRRGSAPVGQ